MVKTSGGLYELVLWIKETIDNKIYGNKMFELKNFAFWNGSNTDVLLRISDENLQILIPLDSIWYNITSVYEYNDKLLDDILGKGFGQIKHIFELHDIARKIVEKKENNLFEIEGKFSISPFSWFEKIDGCKNHIKVWKITRSIYEIRARVGRDNQINCNGYTAYGIFMKGYLVNDAYLNSFLPEQTYFSNSSYGWVPSLAPEVGYLIEECFITADDVKKNYDPIEHYKFLTENQIRKPDLINDHPCFLKNSKFLH